MRPVCATGLDTEAAPTYSKTSGTSMASPQIAGAVALLYQAPAQPDAGADRGLIQDAAHKFTAGGGYESDPQNAGGTTSFDKGAGLPDTAAALDSLGVAKQ